MVQICKFKCSVSHCFNAADILFAHDYCKCTSTYSPEIVRASCHTVVSLFHSPLVREVALAHIAWWRTDTEQIFILCGVNVIDSFDVFGRLCLI